MTDDDRRGRDWPLDGGAVGALIRAGVRGGAPPGTVAALPGDPAAWPGPLRNAVDLILRAPVAMVLAWGPRGVLVGNDAAAVLTGTSPADLVGIGLAEAWPGLALQAADPFEAALAGRATELRDVTLDDPARDDAKVPPVRNPFDLACSPLVDDDGAPAGMLVVLRRAAPSHAASPPPAEAPDPDRAGRSELRRQIRNTLGVTRAVVRRSLQASESLQDLALHLDGRLDAIARAQAIFGSDPAVGADLALVLAEELLAQQIREGERVTLDGPELRLPQRLGERLGLAVHELAVNAIEHGALAAPAGRIAIGWRIDEGLDGVGPRRLVLTWKESGGLTVVGARRRTGFGTELLLRTLPYELKAQVSWEVEPDGLLCVIALPLAAPGAPQASSASAT